MGMDQNPDDEMVPELGDTVEAVMPGTRRFPFEQDVDAEVVQVFKSGNVRLRTDDNETFSVPISAVTVIRRAG